MALSPHIHPEAVRKEIKGPQSGLALYSLISALGAPGHGPAPPGSLISCLLTCMT